MMKKWIAILLTLVMAFTVAAAALAEDGMLRPGDKGEEVTRLQEKLIELQYMDGEATGVYDEATEKAVLWFQEDHYLLRTGIADEITRRMIEEETEPAAQYDYNSYDVCEEAEAGAMYSMATSAPVGGVYSAKGAVNSYAAPGEPAFNTDEYTMFESNRFLSTRTSPLWTPPPTPSSGAGCCLGTLSRRTASGWKKC